MMLSIIYKLIISLQVPRNAIWQMWRGFSIDTSWRLCGLPLVFTAGGNNPLTRFIFAQILGRVSKIRIGRCFRAISKPQLNSLGVIQKTLLRTAAYGAEINIGNNVGLSGCTICATTRVTIGDDTLIGTGAIVTDSDLHPVNPLERLKGGGGKSAPVTIGRNVFVGARAIILKGVTIGDGATIGAGAVVTHSVPANSLAVGNPAKIKELMLKPIG